jgi:hypothetical protein
MSGQSRQGAGLFDVAIPWARLLAAEAMSGDVRGKLTGSQVRPNLFRLTRKVPQPIRLLAAPRVCDPGARRRSMTRGGRELQASRHNGHSFLHQLLQSAVEQPGIPVGPRVASVIRRSPIRHARSHYFASSSPSRSRCVGKNAAPVRAAAKERPSSEFRLVAQSTSSICLPSPAHST